MSSKYDDRRRDRRDSSPSSHSSRRDDRRGSPRSNRSTPPRTDKDLPVQFGRVPDENKDKDDDSNVIQRMKHAPSTSPLCCLTKCLDGQFRLRVWTRNYKEVRGICTGSVVAFDKHWNLLMADVAEVYLKPRKGKTPYIDESTGDSIPDLPPKVPKKKKDASSSKETEAEPPTVTEPPAVAEGEKGTAEKKKKRKKKKKSSPTSHQRELKQCFIRGDNVVMISIEAKSDEE